MDRFREDIRQIGKPLLDDLDALLIKADTYVANVEAERRRTRDEVNRDFARDVLRDAVSIVTNEVVVPARERTQKVSDKLDSGMTPPGTGPADGGNPPPPIGTPPTGSDPLTTTSPTGSPPPVGGPTPGREEAIRNLGEQWQPRGEEDFGALLGAVELKTQTVRSQEVDRLVLNPQWVAVAMAVDGIGNIFVAMPKRAAAVLVDVTIGGDGRVPSFDFNDLHLQVIEEFFSTMIRPLFDPVRLRTGCDHNLHITDRFMDDVNRLVPVSSVILEMTIDTELMDSDTSLLISFDDEAATKVAEALKETRPRRRIAPVGGSKSRRVSFADLTRTGPDADVTGPATTPKATNGEAPADSEETTKQSTPPTEDDDATIEDGIPTTQPTPPAAETTEDPVLNLDRKDADEDEADAEPVAARVAAYYTESVQPRTATVERGELRTINPSMWFGLVSAGLILGSFGIGAYMASGFPEKWWIWLIVAIIAAVIAVFLPEEYNFYRIVSRKRVTTPATTPAHRTTAPRFLPRPIVEDNGG